jgi:hypothetical protein
MPPTPDWLAYVVLAFAMASFFLTLGAIRRTLTSTPSTWTLANALSEEADLSVLDQNGVPVEINGVQVKKTVLVASTSRLVALMGMLVIMVIFVGFGTFELWAFAHTGTVPGAADILKFLAGGLTLFAPYAVNKVATAVSP